MNRYKIRYYSPEGHEWVLMGDEWLAGIKSGGVDGLVGDGDDVTIARVGDVGQSLDSFQPKPMTGTLTVFVRGDDAADVDAVWAGFRSGFSRTRQGTLVVESPSQALSAGVRLSGPIPAPDEDPTSGELVRDVQVPLVADRCGWWTDWLSESGTVTVTNWGDLTVWPQIRWGGAAGTVYLPSGARFPLPKASGERVVSLSMAQAGFITLKDGTPDFELRKQMSGAYPEGVPAGQTRTYRLPTGAALEWQIGVLDPWR